MRETEMAVVIRLKRLGRTHRPFYRIEAMEKQNARNGRSLEILGIYDPMVDDDQKKVKIDVERVKFWIDRGARPSQTVNSFLRKLDIEWGTKRKSRKSLHRKRRAAKKNAG